MPVDWYSMRRRPTYRQLLNGIQQSEYQYQEAA